MPVRDGARFLRKALDSLLAQTEPNITILISDNASRDETEQICLEYSSRFPQILYHRHSEPISVTENFFFTLDRCESNYFMWAAHDDIWSPNFVEALIHSLDFGDWIGAHARLRVIDCEGVYVDEHLAHGRLLSAGSSQNETLRTIRFLWERENLGKANLIYALFRTQALTECFLDFGPQSFEFDCNFLLHLLQSGPIGVTEEATFYKRICVSPAIGTHQENGRRNRMRGRAAARTAKRVISEFSCRGPWSSLLNQYSIHDLKHTRRIAAFVLTIKHIQWPFLNLRLAKRVRRALR